MSKAGKSAALPDDYMDRYENRADKFAVWECEGISKASLERFQVRYDGFSDRLVYVVNGVRGGIPFEYILDQLNSCGGCSAYQSRRVSKHDTSPGSSCATLTLFCGTTAERRSNAGNLKTTLTVST